MSLKDIRFNGFTEEAFEILARLKEAPHIGQYQKEKEGIKRYINEPFKQYRDELVVQWVLPQQLNFETERNIFSRLLKNDFGAGGCHHHKWMSFYRPGLRRLTDVQLGHSLWPDRFSVSLFVGDYAKAPLKQALTNIERDPATFLSTLNPLLQNKKLQYETRKGRQIITDPIDSLPDEILKAHRIWIAHHIAREKVAGDASCFFSEVLTVLDELWPMYRLFTA